MRACGWDWQGPWKGSKMNDVQILSVACCAGGAFTSLLVEAILANRRGQAFRLLCAIWVVIYFAEGAYRNLEWPDDPARDRPRPVNCQPEYIIPEDSSWETETATLPATGAAASIAQHFCTGQITLPNGSIMRETREECQAVQLQRELVQ